MADEANEDSRCSQAPEQHQSHTCSVAADGAGANTDHPAPVQSAPKESAPPIPLLSSRSKRKLKAKHTEGAYGGVRCTPRQRPGPEPLEKDPVMEMTLDGSSPQWDAL